MLDLRNRRVTSFLSTPSFEAWPAFSPDGRWLAYASGESGRSEVYVQPFPGSGGKFQIFHEGGREPLWSRNGKQMFYRWRGQVWSVDIQTDGGFSASKPRLLFDQPGYMGYDGTPRRCAASMMAFDSSLVKIGRFDLP